MDPVRVLPTVVVLVVVLVSVLLGSGAAGYPAWGGPEPGTGDATVEVVSTPETVTLEKTRFDAGTYRLSAPPAVVQVHQVRESPDLTYTIDIPELFFSEITHYPLAGRTGRQSLAFDPVEISPQHVDQDRYEARVAVWLRTGDRYRALAQTEVTVEVAHE